MKSKLVWEDRPKILIWGTGDLAKEFYHKNKDRYDIEGWVDNGQHNWNSTTGLGELLLGKHIYPVYQAMNMNCRIVIVSNHWVDISRQLITCYGKKLGIDFVPYWLFEYEDIDIFKILKIANLDGWDYLIDILKKDKKIVLIHGNCHTTALKLYFNNAPLFYEKFIIFNIPPIQELNNMSDIVQIMSKNIWKHVDILICQRISDEFKIAQLSTEAFMNYRRSDTPVIIIPNVYFDGYWPTIKKNKLCGKKNSREEFQWGFKCIEDMYKKGMDRLQIFKQITSTDFFNSKIVDDAVDNSFSELEKREKDCTIIISDYIRQIYKRQLCFRCPNHPADIIIKQIAIRLLKYVYKNYMNINLLPDEIVFENEEYIPYYCAEDNGAPFFNSIKEYFNLVESEEKFRPSVDGKEYTFNSWFDQYIDEYVFRNGDFI